MNPFFLIFVCLCVPYFLYSILFNLLSQLCSTNKLMKKFSFKIGEEVSVKYKIISLFCLAILASIGTWQIVKYYLFSGVYFWLIIFSGGLLLMVYLAPIGLCVSPFITFKANCPERLKKFYCNFVGSFTLMWALILLIDQSVKIFSDESGISYSNGNLATKILGGVSLLITGLYGLFITSARYSISFNKTETEPSVWMLTGSLIIESLARKINHWKNNNLAQRNRPLFIVLVPFILLGLEVLGLLFFDRIQVFVVLVIDVIPCTVLLITLLLLRKLWLAEKIDTRIKRAGIAILITIWVLFFLVLILIETMDWGVAIKIAPFYILAGGLFLLANAYSFFWTLLDLVKKSNMDKDRNK